MHGAQNVLLNSRLKIVKFKKQWIKRITRIRIKNKLAHAVVLKKK